MSTRPRAKLTSEKVTTIRAAYAAGGTTYGKLASEFGISVTVVAHIVNQRLWKNIGDGIIRKPIRQSRNQKLTPEQVRTIRSESTAGVSARQLGIRNGVSTQCVVNILKRITWRTTV